MHKKNLDSIVVVMIPFMDSATSSKPFDFVAFILSTYKQAIQALIC